MRHPLRTTLALTLAVGGSACSRSAAPAATPTPTTPTADVNRSPTALTRLTPAWQGRVIVDRRDTITLTLANGSKQVQRTGRLALFTLTLTNGNFTVRLDSLQLLPPAPAVAAPALGTTWSGRLGAFGRIENLAPSKGGMLVEDLTPTVASLLPTLPRGGVRAQEVWADTTRRTIRVDIFRTDDRRLSRWRANPVTEMAGLRLVPIGVREDFEQVGQGTSSGREMKMTAQGSRNGVYYMTVDGRIERAAFLDSITKLITIPSSKQSIPTMQVSRTLVSYLPLRAPSGND